MTAHGRILAAVAVCSLMALGCGGGHSRFDTAPVRGTVLCEGQPLTSGTISFTPVAEAKTATTGKSASGAVGPDGTFVLTTYEPEDGAIIGRHTVYYIPPASGEDAEAEVEEEDGEASETAAASPATPLPDTHPCRFGGRAEAEVVEGDNELTIELAGWTPGEEDGDSEAEENAE